MIAMHLPDTVVIGAQRAGTTMLLAALAEHPQVEAVRGEYHGFIDPLYASQGAARIARSFTQADARRRVFKCASYLGRPETAKRLADDLGMPEIVVILRNPVSRAVSAWYWYVFTGRVPLESHEIGLRHLLAGETRGSEWPGGFEMRILEWGLYASLLEHWLAVFPRERVHILTDIDLRRDGAASIQALYASLGLEASHRPSALERPYNSGIRSLRRLRWLRIRTRWSPPTAIWPRVGNALVHAVDRAVLKPVDRTPRLQLSPELRLQLWSYYEADVSRLEQVLGRDFSAWRSEGLGHE